MGIFSNFPIRVLTLNNYKVLAKKKEKGKNRVEINM